MVCSSLSYTLWAHYTYFWFPEWVHIPAPGQSWPTSGQLPSWMAVNLQHRTSLHALIKEYLLWLSAWRDHRTMSLFPAATWDCCDIADPFSGSFHYSLVPLAPVVVQPCFLSHQLCITYSTARLEMVGCTKYSTCWWHPQAVGWALQVDDTFSEISTM